jgi:hypothetical protein
MLKLIYLLSFSFAVNTCSMTLEDAKQYLVSLKNTCVDVLNFAHECGENKAKAEILDKVSPISNTISTLNSDQLANGLEKVGGGVERLGDAVEKAGTVVGDSIKWVGAVGSSIAIAKGAYDFCGWSRKTFFPTDNEKALEERITLELKKFRTERDLNECLIKHALRKKNKDGLPCDCEITAQLFTQVAGCKAYNEIKEEFRKYIGGQK